MRIRYRVNQFWRRVLAQPLPDEAELEVKSLLTDREFELYQMLPPADQEHSYRVMAALRGSHPANHDLLTAALLHDVGKTRYSLSLWERSLIVLLEKTMPGLIGRFGNGSPESWRKPFVVKTQHGRWGAGMVRELGGSEVAAALIERHHETVASNDGTQEALLMRDLQQADNEN